MKALRVPYCYGLNPCVLPYPYVETPIPNVRVLNFRCAHEGRTLRMGLVPL